jgi:poly(3-hydroxybutyrate) depolymerase
MTTYIRAPLGAALPLAVALATTLGTAACGGSAPEGEEPSAQVESAIQVGSDIYTLVGLQSGKCVEVQGGSTASLARLDIATCNGSPRQQFRAEGMGSGFFRLRNVNSNLCVDVSGASTADGAAVIHYACGGGLTPQWSCTDVSGGERVAARHSGKVLDVTGKNTADGTLLEQWTSNGGSNQVFTLQALAGARSAGCGKTRTLQNGNQTLQSGGLTRSYVLRAPDNYDSSHPYRLVVAYHAYGQTAQQVADGSSTLDTPFYGLWNLSNASTIFVAPQGLNNGWANSGGQDVTFTDAVLAQLENELCIDTTRIFANGFSFGGSMSYALACARPNVLRGVAAYSAAQLSGCDGGATPVAYYASHGVVDSTIAISMGRTLRDHFVSVNGCTPQTPPEPAVGSGSHLCTTYQGCSAGHPVTWCAFDAGHTYIPRDSGQSSSWNPAQAWSFISQF